MDTRALVKNNDNMKKKGELIHREISGYIWKGARWYTENERKDTDLGLEFPTKTSTCASTSIKCATKAIQHKVKVTTQSVTLCMGQVQECTSPTQCFDSLVCQLFNEESSQGENYQFLPYTGANKNCQGRLGRRERVIRRMKLSIKFYAIQYSYLHGSIATAGNQQIFLAIYTPHGRGRSGITMVTRNTPTLKTVPVLQWDLWTGHPAQLVLITVAR